MNKAVEPVSDQKKLEFVADARRFLEMFPGHVWGATKELTDEEHIEDYRNVLAKTREAFPDLPERTAMNAVMTSDALLYAFTGNAPLSADRAKALNGFLASMPALLNSVEELIALKSLFSTRVRELLDHNTKQLMENRAQRAIIENQKAQIMWLLNQIPGVQP
ncbi:MULTISPECIES: hypothetical protein [unclassified Bradyrhizobium]|uniref:hypothetical protein n=1 Tax=unclassified Bradyrhizobium TaxID=2631580 RepID=UPI002916A5D4|nr:MULTISPECIES: hypothetical protein [unclassified Bradyrhizobium]